MPLRLENTVQPYAWGSHTGIASLMGRPPSATPEAELWMGAHTLAPSRLPSGETLDLLVAREPERALGAGTRGRHGDRLPFLLKVLAAGRPLSLQAHPSSTQALAGFQREDEAGIPRDAPHRNYKDPYHKPELLVALEPFEALCGFRPIADILSLFDALGVDAVGPLRARPDAGGLRDTFAALVSDRSQVAAVVGAAARLATTTSRFAPGARWVGKLAELYPGDPGLVVSLLLEVLELAPGEGVYMSAGNLHAYLCGVGIEIMASSDNVLRGGLTPKHVDVPELLSTLDFAAPPVRPLRPIGAGPEVVYDTPSLPGGASEFLLSCVTVAAPFVAAVDGPEIFLVTAGNVTVDGVALPRGGSMFVPASDGRYVLAGQGTVFRARVPGGADALS